MWIDWLKNFLQYSGPYLIVSGVGILLAVTRWQRHPNVSLLLLLACLLNIACVLVYPVVNLIVPDWWEQELRTIVPLLNLVAGVAATGLFIAASLSQCSVKPERTLTLGGGSELDEEPKQSFRPTETGKKEHVTSTDSFPITNTLHLKTRLRRLEDLHNDDLLTDAEYQAKREEILGEV